MESVYSGPRKWECVDTAPYGALTGGEPLPRPELGTSGRGLRLAGRGKIACEVVRGRGHPATVTLALRDGRTVPACLFHTRRDARRTGAQFLGSAR